MVDLVEREKWTEKTEYLLTVVGFAVGLGNIWRFPYLVYDNGGGAFLIPYLIMLSIVGIPLFFLETSFGQFSSRSLLTLWKVIPLFKGLGFSMLTVAFTIGLFYNIIITWSIYFFFASLISPLPWSSCGLLSNPSIKCIDTETFSNITHHCARVNFSSFLGNLDDCPKMKAELDARPGLSNWKDLRAPSSDYYYSELLERSASIDEYGGIVWKVALCLAFSWLVIFLVLAKGVQSLGKVMYAATILPYVMLTCILLRGLTLPGAWTGIKYYLTPDLAHLAKGDVWCKAATQIFFSLSTCSGGLIVLGSYNNFHNNSLKDSLLVPLINCGTSLYAGFAVFSLLGFMAHTKGIDIKDVAQQGPGLVFEVYPEVLTQFPASQIWSIVFFMMLVLLGWSSMFSITESLMMSITDEFASIIRVNKTREIIFRGIFVAVCYIVSLSMTTNGGFYMLDVLNDFIGQFPLLINGLLEIVVVQYVYGWRNFNDDLHMMLGEKPHIFFRVCWCTVTPLALLITTLMLAVNYKPIGPSPGQVYPAWAQAVGWSITIGSIAWLPVWMIVQTYRYGGVNNALLVDPLWGPADDINRTGRYAPLQRDQGPSQSKDAEQ